MDWLVKWFTNTYFLIPLCSWGVAQIVKVIVNLIVTRKWDVERLLGDGGMPSSHSALVASLATICALNCGTDSVEFAITAILAMIVCHDATGVRQEAGKHAMLLDRIINSFDDIYREKIPEVQLKKFVGHTFVQVMAGIAIGILNTCLFHFVILR